MKDFFSLLLPFVLLCSPSAMADKVQTLSNNCMQVTVNDSGQITTFRYIQGNEWNHIPFVSKGKYKGPALSLNGQAVAFRRDAGQSEDFRCENDSLSYRMQYILQEKSLLLKLSVKNKRDKSLPLRKISIKTGIDSYMTEYPQWDKIHFPTMLRCEKTHFWGYTMSPDGSILAIGSPSPIVSWSIDYVSHHRLGSFDLDLTNKIKQPERHPGSPDLAAGEERNWDIYLSPLQDMKEIKPFLSGICQAPMMDITGQHTITPNETTVIDVYSDTGVKMSATTPSGITYHLKESNQKSGKKQFTFKPMSEYGVYTLLASSKNGKRSEAKIYVRKPWSWYLEKARVAAIEAPPLPARYSEWFYNVYTALNAARYIPDAALDSITFGNWKKILVQMYDAEENRSLIASSNHIQWYYNMVGILVRSYQLTNDIQDLQMASNIADLLINTYQASDGSFRNGSGTHYTCVIYASKPLLELALEEKKLAAADKNWHSNYERHYRAGEKAVEDLLKRLDNIETEGEQTFEDGMISCSALQLGFMGVLTENEQIRKQYADATEYMLTKHRCLEALQVPDCRMIGGTFRFWEAYHDLRITPNMMNSPHGWSSWKTYATYYAYLLTGKEEWLRLTMDAVGSAMQMVHPETGKLSWAFVPNPYIEAKSLVKEDPKVVGTGSYEDRLIGEQYLEMKRYWRKAQASDNDVHEHFKMMSEVALLNAFILERKDGTLFTYNCQAKKKGNVIEIEPYERLVQNIHVNLQKDHTLRISLEDKEVTRHVKKGMSWVRPAAKDIQH